MATWRTCPACAAESMSTPVRSRRTGAYTSTCMNFPCGHTVHRQAMPALPAANLPERHGRMFWPSTTEREPPPVRVRTSAMARFEKAHVAGAVKRAIAANQRQVAVAAAGDAKQRQLGRDA